MDNIKLQKVEKAYSAPTWWYDTRGFFILTFCYCDNIRNQINFYSKNVKSNHLEAAIGTGTLTKLIELWNLYFKKGLKIKGSAFDYSEKMLTAAKWKFDSSQLNLIVADAANLPYKKDSFDSINLANALHCIPDINKAVDEIFRVLKPNCFLFTNVLIYPQNKNLLDKLSSLICNWGIKKGILYTPYSKDEIFLILTNAQFKIVTSFQVGNNLYIICKKLSVT